MCSLVFCQTDTSFSHLGTGTLNWENDSIKLTCRQACFSWLMTDVGGPSFCGWCRPWAGGPEFHRKAIWKTQQAAFFHSLCFRSCLHTPAVLKLLPQKLLTRSVSVMSVCFLCSDTCMIEMWRLEDKFVCWFSLSTLISFVAHCCLNQAN